jgi:hypothetical protein
MVFRRGQKQLIVKEQIQLYCANAMVAHPMVTLVNQGSLGGLSPMLVVGSSVFVRYNIALLIHGRAL